MPRHKSIDNSEKILQILEAIWTQRQLDDLHLMNQSILQQLKQNPFHAKHLERRDKVQHDIDKLQHIVLATGLIVASHIEKKFNVSFCLLSARNTPEKKSEQKALTELGKQ